MKEVRDAKYYAKMIVIVLCWLALWEIADRIINNRIVLSGPIHIIGALGEQIRQPDFWVTCGASFARITVGFLLSFVAGFLLAVLCYRFTLLRDIITPVMVTLKIVPMISFVIMLLIWVGNQALTIYLSFLIVLPLIYTNTLAGLNAVDKNLLEVAKEYGCSWWYRFYYFYRPTLMPFVISACRIALGMSWKSGIMAEVIGTPKPSIGREMYAAKTYLQTANLFAWTIVVVVLSLLFERIFMLLLNKCNPIKGEEAQKMMMKNKMGV